LAERAGRPWWRLVSVVRPRERRASGRSRSTKYPEALLERATRLVFESGRPIAHVVRDLGVPSETLRVYVRRVEANEGGRKDVLSGEEREKIRKLRRENSEGPFRGRAHLPDLGRVGVRLLSARDRKASHRSEVPTYDNSMAESFVDSFKTELIID
jgi:transposase